MEVRIEDISPVEKKMVVQIPWNTVNKRLSVAYRELARSVAIKGFRKGNAPRNILERMYGPRVGAEVLSEFVQESFADAIQNHKLEAVSEPQLAEIIPFKKGQDYSFEAMVEVKGDVLAKDYKGMELEKRIVKVDEELVTTKLETLRQEHIDLTPIEGRETTANTDVLTLKVRGKLEEHSLDHEQLEVDLEDSDRSPLPGLTEALIGLPIDAQDHSIELTMPEDHREESIAGKVAKMTISIIDARQKLLPELDDEFAKDTGMAETLDELTKIVRDEIEASVRQNVEQELTQTTITALVKNNPIPVANSLVTRAIQFKIERWQRMLGMDVAKQFPIDEQMVEGLRASSVDDVRSELLIDAVATQESIEVSEEEIEQEIQKVAAEKSISPKKLRAQFEREDKLDNIRLSVKHDKVIAFLVDNAQITEVEELTKPPEAAEGHVHGPDCDHDHEPAVEESKKDDE